MEMIILTPNSFQGHCMSLGVSTLNLSIIALLLLFVATILVSLHQGVAHG